MSKIPSIFGILPKRSVDSDDNDEQTPCGGILVPEIAMANWLSSSDAHGSRANFIEITAEPEKYFVFGNLNIPINTRQREGLSVYLTLVNKETGDLAEMYPGRMIYYTTRERRDETLFFPENVFYEPPENCEHGAVKDVSPDIITLMGIIAEVFSVERIPFFITLGNIRYLVNNTSPEPVRKKRGGTKLKLQKSGGTPIAKTCVEETPTHVYQVLVRNVVVFSTLSETLAVRYIEENQPIMASYELDAPDSAVQVSASKPLSGIRPM